MPEQKAATAPAGKKVTIYLAAAPFDLDGQHYAAGDEVALVGWVRDLTIDAQRLEAAMGDDKPLGLSFYKEGAIVDKASKERLVVRVILPVKEA